MNEQNEKTDIIDEVGLDITPLEDDELEAVAGGITKAKAADAEAKAKADGRVHRLPVGNLLCLDNHKYKWAREYTKGIKQGTAYFIYSDVKCYKCGKVWGKYDDYTL